MSDRYIETTRENKEVEEKEREKIEQDNLRKEKQEREKTERIKEIDVKRSQEKLKFDIAVKNLANMIQEENEDEQKHLVESIKA